MNDDPTQTFPETHWKRHATEAVCTPARDSASAPKLAAPSDAMTPPVQPREAQKVAKVPTRPLLS